MNDCSRFRSLTGEGRELSPTEDTFVRQHRVNCVPCVRYEDSMLGAMSAFKSLKMEVDVDDSFNVGFFRVWNVLKERETVRYWLPAFGGALVACTILLASLQVVAKSTENPVFRPSNEDARLMHTTTNERPLLLIKHSASKSKPVSADAR